MTNGIPLTPKEQREFDAVFENLEDLGRNYDRQSDKSNRKSSVSVGKIIEKSKSATEQSTDITRNNYELFT